MDVFVMYEIVPATIEHARKIALTMREKDRQEITGWGHVPRHLLRMLLRDSPIKRAAIIDGQIAGLWGVQSGLLSDDGLVWLFTARCIEDAKFAFMRETKREIAELMTRYRRLRSYVAADYTQSIRFFEMLGFSIGPAEPIGKDGVPYRLMTLERSPATAPFIVLGMPRSRTYWLSRFLSYGDWRCHHEAALTMRSIDDVKAFFARPRTGASETAAAPGWSILRHHIPELRTVVVRRPVADVVDAMLRVDVSSVATYDRRKLHRNMVLLERSLDKVSRHPGTLTIDHTDLDQEDVCARVFQHCLPYEMPREWWHGMRERNLQVDPAVGLRYYMAHRDAVEGFKSACKTEIWRLARAGQIEAA